MDRKKWGFFLSDKIFYRIIFFLRFCLIYGSVTGSGLVYSFFAYLASTSSCRAQSSYHGLQYLFHRSVVLAPVVLLDALGVAWHRARLVVAARVEAAPESAVSAASLA